MQIIGLTEEGFIFKASQIEIEKLTNTYYGEKIISDLKIGTIFEIDKMFYHANGILSNYERIIDIQKTLQNIIDYTKKIKPIIAPEYKKENE